eukprot:TRINITY_DN359_c0_g1_i4.p1 TRINITY_DN359_c0_g1~~TRINITY_DN359_c0_g1_i4.p1  ORF type:complete len:114 (-),score=1.17 TRINITY_DN359_c0_g1_i4:220-561(-)
MSFKSVGYKLSFKGIQVSIHESLFFRDFFAEELMPISPIHDPPKFAKRKRNNYVSPSLKRTKTIFFLCATNAFIDFQQFRDFFLISTIPTMRPFENPYSCCIDNIALFQRKKY